MGFEFSLFLVSMVVIEVVDLNRRNKGYKNSAIRWINLGGSNVQPDDYTVLKILYYALKGC